MFNFELNFVEFLAGGHPPPMFLAVFVLMPFGQKLFRISFKIDQNSYFVMSVIIFIPFLYV